MLQISCHKNFPFSWNSSLTSRVLWATPFTPRSVCRPRRGQDEHGQLAHFSFGMRSSQRQVRNGELRRSIGVPTLQWHVLLNCLCCRPIPESLPSWLRGKRVNGLRHWACGSYKHIQIQLLRLSFYICKTGIGKVSIT